MRYVVLIFSLFAFNALYIKAQIVEKQDTLYINYSITAGEFDNRDEGIMIYHKNSGINAIGIRYKNSSISFLLKDISTFYDEKDITVEKIKTDWESYIIQRDSLERNSLVNFYKQNKNYYTVIKEEWTLSKEQCEYVTRLIDEIKLRPVDKNVYSNAGEHYSIINQNGCYIFIDRIGDWNKFLEINEIFDIRDSINR